MQIDVVTRYECKWRKPRKVNHEITLAFASVPLDIREVPAGEFTPVHRVHMAYSDEEVHQAGVRNRNDRMFASSVDRPVTVHDWNGTLWVQRTRTADFLELVASEEDDNPFLVYAEDTEGHTRIGPWSVDLHEKTKTEAELVKEHGKLRDFTEHLDRSVALLAARAAQFAVMDGWVCERVREPVIAVMAHAGCPKVTILLGEVDDERGPFRSRRADTFSPLGRRFGLDELAAARTFAVDLASDLGVEVDNRVTVEHVSPWAVRFRGDSEHLRFAAEKASEALRDLLPELDETLGLAVHDLTHALARAPGLTPVIADAALRVDALARVAGDGGLFARPNAEVEQEARRYGRAKPAPNQSLEVLTRACERWAMRESEGMEWVERALPATGTYSGREAAFELTSLRDVDLAAETLGVDLSDVASEAARGDCHLVAVESSGQLVAVAVARAAPNGVEVPVVFTSHGARANARVTAVVEAHLAASGPAQVDDLTFAGL